MGFEGIFTGFDGYFFVGFSWTFTHEISTDFGGI